MTRRDRHTNGRNGVIIEVPADQSLDARTSLGHPLPSAPSRGAEHVSHELVTIEQLSEWLQVPKQTVYKWRSHGHGPRGFRIGRHVRFAASDVRSWLDQQRDT